MYDGSTVTLANLFDKTIIIITNTASLTAADILAISDTHATYCTTIDNLIASTFVTFKCQNSETKGRYLWGLSPHNRGFAVFEFQIIPASSGACGCAANQYRSVDDGQCKACPPGTTSPQASVDISSCVCSLPTASLDASLAHWLRFEDAAALNFDSITGAAVGTLSQTAYFKYRQATGSHAFMGGSLDLYRHDTTAACDTMTGAPARRGLSITPSGNFFSTQSWTFAAFVKTNPCQRHEAIIAFLNKIDGTDKGIWLYTENTRTGYAEAGTGMLRWQDMGGISMEGFSDDGEQYNANTQYVHIALVFSCSNPPTCDKDSSTFTVYMEGNEKFGGAKKILTTDASTQFANRHITIGYDDSDNRYGHAKLDDLRIYSRVLTQPEIALLAGQSSSTPEVSPCTCGGPGGTGDFIGVSNCANTCPYDDHQIGTAYNHYRLVATSSTVNLASLSFKDSTSSALQIEYSIEALTGMSGWTKIKHKPASVDNFDGNTFKGGGGFDGTVTTGDPAVNNAQWAITFDPAQVTFFCFHAKDSLLNSTFKDRWVVIEESELKRESEFESAGGRYGYDSAYPHYYKTTYKPNGFTAKSSTYYTGARRDQIIYNRESNAGDPFLMTYFVRNDGTVVDPHVDFANIGTLVYPGVTSFLYAENGVGMVPGVEMAVYIKTTPDTSPPPPPHDSATVSTDASSSTVVSDTVYTFTTAGTPQYITLTAASRCHILVVGGGGGTGKYGAGGGGGDVLHFENIDLPADTYDINVGAGGGSSGTTHADNSNWQAGQNGTKSSFVGQTSSINIVAAGGGGGGSYDVNGLDGPTETYTNPVTGTSATSQGGGGGVTNGSPGSGGTVSGSGGDDDTVTAGGGGGAGGVFDGTGADGQDGSSSKGGDGGTGYSTDISGSLISYGGGGGGTGWGAGKNGGTGQDGGGNGANAGETGTQELQTEEVGVVGKVGPPALLV